MRALVIGECFYTIGKFKDRLVKYEVLSLGDGIVSDYAWTVGCNIQRDDDGVLSPFINYNLLIQDYDDLIITIGDEICITESEYLIRNIK